MHALQKEKGCLDLIWLPQFHTSSASLNTVETVPTDCFTFQTVIRLSRTLVNSYSCRYWGISYQIHI